MNEGGNGGLQSLAAHRDQAARCFGANTRARLDGLARLAFFDAPALRRRVLSLSGAIGGAVFADNDESAPAGKTAADGSTTAAGSGALIVSGGQQRPAAAAAALAIRRQREESGTGFASIASVAGAAAAGGSEGTDGIDGAVDGDLRELRRRALVVRAEAAAAAASSAAGAAAGGPTHRWKVFRVSAVQGGATRAQALAVDASNAWFASGDSGGQIRVWDLVTGQHKLTFDGGVHINGVRGLATSLLSPYLFSCGSDKLVRCWDLETNKIARDFFGHLSAVRCVATHPRMEHVVISGGQDQTVRVWDMRKKDAVFHVLQHSGAVTSVAAQDASPQLVSGDDSGLVWLWDMGTGRAITQLTRHKKAIRAVVLHPGESSVASVAADAVRKWRAPVGEYMGALGGSAWLPPTSDHGGGGGGGGAASSAAAAAATSGPAMNTVWTCASYSAAHDCVAIGAESGQLLFADWASWRVTQEARTLQLKGTAPGEGGILCCAFDRSGEFLITGEGDKSIKHWRRVPVVQQAAAAATAAAAQ
jgi:pleiotropic regulator 1